jgi:CBS domain containing-hemolysin-like protein
MTFAFLALTTCALCALLVVTTLMQYLYMDSVRIRARDLPMLELFRESISERMNLSTDDGILVFSLIKHSMLVALGVLVLYLASSGTIVTLIDLLEAVVASWFIMMLVGYVVPQTLYRRTRGKWILRTLPFFRGLAFGIRPLVAVLTFFQSLSQLGEKSGQEEEQARQEENIDALFDAGAEEGILEEEDRRLFHSVVAFGDKTVREVMTPRPSIIAIEADRTLEDLRKVVIHEQFSRIPVFEGSVDNITGFVHVRDMFELEEGERFTRTVRELTRPIRLVPESKPVTDLLREMQKDGAHMAVVIDEYGNTAGLVTMEDMVEEIVGEIRDEHEPGHDIHEDYSGGFVVSGSFDLDHLRELLEFHRPEDIESTTVGGLATEWLGHVPEPGEVVEREGIRIEVLASNELRVDQVRISRVEQQTQNA